MKNFCDINIIRSEPEFHFLLTAAPLLLSLVFFLDLLFALLFALLLVLLFFLMLFLPFVLLPGSSVWFFCLVFLIVISICILTGLLLSLRSGPYLLMYDCPYMFHVKHVLSSFIFLFDIPVTLKRLLPCRPPVSDAVNSCKVSRETFAVTIWIIATILKFRHIIISDVSKVHVCNTLYAFNTFYAFDTLFVCNTLYAFNTLYVCKTLYACNSPCACNSLYVCNSLYPCNTPCACNMLCIFKTLCIFS